MRKKSERSTIRRLPIWLCLAAIPAWVACTPAPEASPAPPSMEAESGHPCLRPEFNSGWPSRAIPYDAELAASDEPAAVQGWVFDLAGNPLSVLVGFVPPDTTRSGELIVSEADGSFRFTDVSPGTGELRLLPGTFLWQTHRVQLLSGRTDTLCVILRARAMSLPEISPGV